MSAPRWGDTAGPHSGEDEAPIPEGDRRGAGPSRVETRGGEDSGQGNLEGEADLPRTAGRVEQAALRQIVQVESRGNYRLEISPQFLNFSLGSKFSGWKWNSRWHSRLDSGGLPLRLSQHQGLDFRQVRS